MLRLIVGFMKNLIEWAAMFLLAAGAYGGYMYADMRGEHGWDQAIWTAIGILGGLFTAVIALGIPALLLRINENLERLNAAVEVARKEQQRSAARATEHPLGAAFPVREPADA